MKPKVSVFIATSLDGFIARKDGEIDFLNAVDDSIPEGEDCGYGEHIKTVDAIVMGRNSYEKVISFGIPWPYGKMKMVVLSSQPIEFAEGVPDCVTQSSESPEELCQRLYQSGTRHIYVDGGKTIQQFLSARLIDQFTITLIPVILGEGIPLFGPMENDVSLTPIATHQYEFGLVQLKYAVNQG